MRADIVVTGIVQGVGFRPFVYRTAVQNGLTGFVRNRGDAVVEITVKGTRAQIDQFLRNLQDKKPPLAQINDLHVAFTEDESDFSQFSILESRNAADLSGSVIPPDVAICDECCRELRNPANRRHGYFFITCVDCGPRYSIIEHLPYDRPNTTMSKFETCDRCKQEYENPANRRFHAQTVACDACGPHVYLTSNDGNVLDARALLQTIPGLTFTEMGRIRENSFCCGGGGGRMWVEESAEVPETRPAISRVNEAVATGATTLATGCPYCVLTLEDGVKLADLEGKLNVKDLSELICEAL